MTTNIWMVIDGGVTDRMGCFGWVIATDSRIIYEHSDITTRNSKQIDSCRAKAEGLLDALQFLDMLSHYNHTTHHTLYMHYCDNITVTDQMAQSLKYNKWYPNQTTLPHLDMNDDDTMSSNGDTIIETTIFTERTH